MAKSKRRSGDAPALAYYAIVAIGTILLTAVVYTPIGLVAALLLCRRSGSDSPPQEHIPAETIRALDPLEAELIAKLRRLEEIEEEGAAADLSVNVDGSFHRGSRLGKQLNAEIESLVPRVEDLRDLTDDLRMAPLAGFRRSMHLMAGRKALTWSLGTYAAAFVGLCVLGNPLARQISPFVTKTILVRLPVGESVVHGAATLAGLGALLALPIFYLVERWVLYTRYAPLREAFTAFASDTVENRGAPGSATQPPDVRHIHHGAGDAAGEETRDEEEELKAQPWHVILGVSPWASADEINAAYRGKMLKCHPDRVAGLDPAIVELAEERTQLLNAAREEGLRRRRPAP